MRKSFVFIVLLMNSVFGLYAVQTPFINIFDSVEGCVVPYDKTAIFNIRVDWSSDPIVSNLNTPFVGRLDADTIPEIMCFALDGEDILHQPHTVNQILVFDGSSHQLRQTIPLVARISAFDAAGYGMVKLPNGKGIIVTVEQDGYLRAYDFLSYNPGSPYWTSDEPVSTEPSAYACNVGFADFNNDGVPEVYVRNRIFNAATGVLLATATGGTNQGESYSHYSHLTEWKISAPMASNICGDQRVELVLGNEIYDVQISNTDGTLGNSVSLLKTISPPAGVVADGHTQVADFNLDGNLDVFISNRDMYSHTGVVSGYIWDVVNNTVSLPFVISTNKSGKSIPLISDINNDSIPEIIIQCGVTESTTDKIQAYRYNISTNDFTRIWTLPTDEDSYSNTMTSFDFNQDGISELLVCDQKTVRIVNGSGISHLTYNDTIPVYVISSFDFDEITIMQYPVIADVNADGSTEFVSVGSHQLNIFTSATGAWAASRPVWNQYMYNVTNVNNDLTIPTILTDNAIAVIDPKDSTKIRPFNNCLQQVCSRKGFFAADAAVPTKVEYMLKDRQLCASLQITNQGSMVLRSPCYITVYADSLRGTVLGKDTLFSDVEKQASTTASICLAVDTLCEKNIRRIAFSVNDNGHGIAQEGGLQPECDLDNNIGYIHLGDVFDTIFAVARCKRDLPYVWRGQSCDSAGLYTDTLVNFLGCDSILKLRLIVFPEQHDTLFDTICSGSSYVWKGHIFTRDTVCSDTSLSVLGCDSISWLYLYVIPAAYSAESYTICEGEQVSIYGKPYAAAGIYLDTIPSIGGCDSIIQIEIITKSCSVPGPSPFDDPDHPLNPYFGCDTAYSHTYANIKEKELPTFQWNGILMNRIPHNNHQDTTLVAPLMKADQSCDSIATLHLHVLFPCELPTETKPVRWRKEGEW